jgi:phosphomannomutase/phosphoglucomutase
MSIFKDCDIRGVYGPELNEQTAYQLGRAVASRMNGQRVVVGGDLRTSTPNLKSALIDGLVASGGDVVDLGTIPTPALYFGKKVFRAVGGVMVTASHNPPRYNGFKLIFGELPVTPDDLEAVSQQMSMRTFREGQGMCREEAILDAYVESLAAAFPDLRPRHVAVDAGNGSLWSVAPAVLRRVGQTVGELNCTPDGTFPHRDPNPAVPEHLRDLAQYVVKTGAELGAGYDGDGDRVILVDDRGRVQPADRTLVLLVRHLLSQHPAGKVVYDLKCSSVVAEEVLAAGGRPLMEKAGHAFIKRRLLAEGAVLGGEASGHYFFGALGGDDALYATLMLLRVLDAMGQSAAAAMDTVPSYPITPDIRVPCPPERARVILQELRDAFADYPVDTLDGVRIQFPDGWALVRVSVTEPMITLRFESHTPDQLVEIQRLVRQRSLSLDELLEEHKTYKQGEAG